MTEKTVVVAAANDAYFGFLEELLQSFHDCGAGRRHDFVVLDVGLGKDKLKTLTRLGVTLVFRPDWPVSGLDGQPEWFKTMVCRPFYPHYFKDWDIIVSVDADSWFQNDRGIDLAIAGARRHGFAVVPQIDRGYWEPHARANGGLTLPWQKDSLAQGFGEEIAAQFYEYPIISAGFFAGHRTAPHWAVWQQYLVQGLRRKIYFSIEQAALTLMVHQARLPTHFLPGHCHWTSHIGTLGFDARTGQYVEPYLPHEPIAVIALAAHSKSEPVPVATTDGRLLRRRLRYGQALAATTEPLEVVVGDAPHAFDGMATPYFRDHLFSLLSRGRQVRLVQIGAMDGVMLDPVHAAVRRHGWSAVLVEPLPDMMARLQTNYAGIDGITFVQAAIAEESGRQTMQRVSAAAVAAGALPFWAEGIASLLPERNALGGKTLTAEQARAVAQASENIEVDTLAFADLASRHGIDGFDVLLIDAEGYDWRILRQVDLARHAPDCIQIELACLPGEEITAALHHLRAAGYVCHVMEDGLDLLAVSSRFGNEGRYA